MFRKICAFVLTLALLVAFVPALPSYAQDETPAVEVADQVSVDSTVTIARVYSEGPGFIVIHADGGGAPGPVIGYLPVPDGESTAIKVAIDHAMATPVLYAMLHADTGEVGVYEFGTVEGADGPVMVDNNMVSPAFNVTLLDAKDQFITNNQVTIHHVITANPTWVVIHADADSAPGPVLGQTLVQPGVNEDVTVDLTGDLTSVLWPMLHEDTGEQGVYEFGTVEGADAPIIIDGVMAVLPIWTVPHIRMAVPLAGMDTTAPPTVTAKSVLSQGPGWLVIHSDNAGSPGPVLGETLLTDGLNENVVVELSADGLTDVVWPMLHADTGELGVYEFGTVEGADAPVSVDGNVVVFSFDRMGTEGEMMSSMDMGPAATEESAAPQSNALDGNALVSERCTVCHSRDRIELEG